LKTNVEAMKAKETSKRAQQVKSVDKAVKNYVQNFDEPVSTVEEGAMSYSNFLNNKMMLVEAIRKGLSYDLFSKIKKITPFTEEDWADYLSLSKKSLQRYQKEKNFFFKPIHSEKIIELAEVTNFGRDVFDSKEQFYLWLNTPSYALNNLKPAELLKDSYGKEMVMAELNRIDHGIFA